MADSATSLWEVFQTIFLVGGLCCLPLLAIGSIIYSFSVSMKQRKAGERLTPAMNLTLLHDGNHPLRNWYGGTHQGRQYALQTFVVMSSTYIEGRRRNSYKTHLRVVMDVGVDQPLGVTATQNRKVKTPQNYAAAFVGEGLDLLSSPARRALFGFLKKGYPTGITKDLGIRFSRGKRSISLFDRAGKVETMLAAEVLPAAQAVLIFDHNDAGVSPEDLRQYLDEMVAVARAIESGTPAEQLNPDNIPEESALAKNGATIFALFVALGLPAICCVCASTLVALQG